VLQRIAICYFLTSIMFLNFKLRGKIATFVGLLIGYWAIMTFVPVPGIGAGSFAADTNLANWVDRNYVPGKLYDFARDPEGLLSTLPAVCHLFAWSLCWAFRARQSGFAAEQDNMAACGWLRVARFGLPLGAAIPNHQGDLDLIICASDPVATACFSWQSYIKSSMWRMRRWTKVFTWIGANAIALYFLNEVLSYQNMASRLVSGNVINVLDRTVAPGTGNFVIALLALSIAVLLARYLYKHKIFVCV
jgi:predicted acyltransferase